jgi:hypothetical protein
VGAELVSHFRRSADRGIHDSASCRTVPVVLTTHAAAAQTHLQGPSWSELFAFGARPLPVASRDTVAKAIPATHWKTGLLVGGVAGGLALGALAIGLCNDSDDQDKNCFLPAVAGAALGVAAGGTSGALIGGLFPKHKAADSLPPGP